MKNLKFSKQTLLLILGGFAIIVLLGFVGLTVPRPGLVSSPFGDSKPPATEQVAPTLPVEKTEKGTTVPLEGFVFGYSDLLAAIEAKQVARARVNENSRTVDVMLKSGRQAEVGYLGSGEEIASQLFASGAVVETEPLKQPPGGFRTVLMRLLPFLLIGFLILLFIRMRSKGGAGGAGMMGKVGSMKKGTKVETAPNVTFKDVAGCDEAVYELQEVVEFLRDPSRFAKLGAKMPRGVLLYGDPGTGKTLMAKALAGEAGVPFFAASGSDFVEMFVGVGASRVRDLFEQARKEPKGAIIFIDEIDAIGKKRGPNMSGGNDEREGTLNQLLVEMDGFEDGTRSPVVVIGATNRLDVLDSALTRPGRFDRSIAIPLPTEEGRLQILGVHTKGKPMGEDVDLPRLARMTAGLSGAQLSQIANEGAIMAARSGRKEILMEDFDEGWLRVLAGPERTSHPADTKDMRTIAYHEAGHALAAELCPSQNKAERVTIRARGQALGLAAYGQTDRALHDLTMMHEWLICILGGRAAEQILNGIVSSGAMNDLQKANAVARRAIEELGFSPRVGQITSGPEGGAGFSERTRGIVDEEVERMIAEAYGDAVAILKSNWDKLEAIAELLIRQEDIDRLDIQTAIAGGLRQEALSGGKHLFPRSVPVLSNLERQSDSPPQHQMPRRRLPLIPALIGSLAKRKSRRGAQGKPSGV